MNEWRAVVESVVVEPPSTMMFVLPLRATFTNEMAAPPLVFEIVKWVESTPFA